MLKIWILNAFKYLSFLQNLGLGSLGFTFWRNMHRSGCAICACLFSKKFRLHFFRHEAPTIQIVNSIDFNFIFKLGCFLYLFRLKKKLFI